jgi:hypothetical protein
MPRIRGYQEQVSSQGDFPQRSAYGTDFGGAGMVNLGNAVQQLGSDAGQIQRFLLANKSRQEVTDAQTGLMRLQADSEQELLAKYKAWKPGDPSLAESYQGIIKQRLDTFGYTEDGTEKYVTQAGNNAFRTGAEHLSATVMKHASTLDADLAGKAAVIQYNETVAKQGNFLQAHPNFYELRKEEFGAIIDNPHGVYSTIPGVEREKLRQEGTAALAIAAAQGHIRKAPHVMLEKFRDPALAQDEQYGWIARDIPANKFDDLIRQANTEAHALETEQARLEAERKREAIELSRTKEAGLVEKLLMHQQDRSQPALTSADVLTAMDEGMDGEKGLTMWRLLEAQAKEDPYKPVHTNPAVENMLFKRIHLPDNDPKKIIELDDVIKYKSQLSWSSFNYLKQEIIENRSPEGSVFNKEKAEFYKAYEQQVLKPGPFGIYADPTNGGHWLRFKADTEEAIKQIRKEGGNPRDVFNPKSQHFRGSKEVLSQYTATGFGSTGAEPAAAPVPPANRKPLGSILGIGGS